MKNRKLIYIISLSLSFIFSVGYYIVFSNISNKETISERKLYMNQVGLYKEEKSVENMKAKLESLSLLFYSYKKDDVVAVVTSVYEDESKTKKEQELLTKANLSFVSKEVTIKDKKVISYMNEKNYAKVLEMIQDKS